MDKPLIDVPVSMIFFNRPDTLKKVFDAVREAKPTKLFLIQDGARDNREDDVINIEKCRKIFDDIDWDCEVTKIYADKNLGCGKRIYTGIKEVFTYVDRTIILEDDIVASQDFFRFCAEMLEKYKDDPRIIDIAGMNHTGTTERCPYSYFFSEIGSCWGWATWKRSWDKMEYNMDFLDDEYAIKCFLKLPMRTPKMRKDLVKDGFKRRDILQSGGKLSAWTYQFLMAGYLNSTLSVVPQRNLISNIGLTPESGHASNSINKIPKGLQRVFFAPVYEMSFPLKHPKYMIKDNDYAEEVYKILGIKPLRKFYRRIEGLVRQVIFMEKGDGRLLVQKVNKKLKS